jgi:cysteine-rich repeat protein
MRGIIVGILFALVACGGGGGGGGGDPEPPVIAGASLTTDEDAPIVYAVEASDPKGGALTLEAQPPQHGAVSIDQLRVTYTPAPNYHGPDSFAVTVSNGMRFASAQIDVMVRSVNDVPTVAADAFAALEDVPLVRPISALLANDLDVDGDPLAVMSVQGATNGTVSMAGTAVTFTPAANYSGMASFQYTVGDGMATATATVAITVGGVNDAPIAVDDTAVTPEDVPFAIGGAVLVANDTDTENQTLTVTAVGNATHGTVMLAGGTATFTPAANYSGPATFEYAVSDGAATATGRVAVAVVPVNDAPVAADDTAATSEDTAIQLTSSALIANDADVDGPGLAVTQVGNAASGTVVLMGGIATFTPAANFSGAGSFEYTVSDGTDTDTGRVAINVIAVNDPPVATDDTAAIAEDTQLVIAPASLIANDTDVDGPSLVVTQVGGATNGTVVLMGGTVRFTPAANYSGAASFTYTLSDGTAIDTGVVAVNVTPVNDAPIAVDDVNAVMSGGSVVIPKAALLANDTDVDGPALAVTAVQNAVHGTAVLGATTVTFTPAAGYSGPASFDYVVSDGMASDVGTVAITVQTVCGDGAIGPPETCDDGGTSAGDGCSAACAIEPGWSCTGAPSLCTPICGDGMVVGNEVCDDGNANQTDGCTTQCVIGALCTAAALPGGDRFAVDPATGHCYASFDFEMTTFGVAQEACAAAGGYLVTIRSAGEQALAHAVQNPAQNPWIGAAEDDNDADAVFDWVTDESFGFATFAPGQPDDDAGVDGNGDCLHMFNIAGQWNDTNCDINTYVIGRICEVEPAPCGDSIRQLPIGEECDDGNTTGGDGCSATCQIEDGCGDGNLDPGEECDDDNRTDGDGCSSSCGLENGCGDGNLDLGEECDDDNTTSGDGCSATCQKELVVVFSFNGALGNEVSFPADTQAPGIGVIPAMSRGVGLLAQFPAADAFNANGFTSAVTLDPLDYFSFTVAPAAGFTVSLLGITLDERRSATGIRAWSVRSSLDGFIADLASFSVPDDINTRVNQPIPLGPEFRTLAAPVEFRIFGFAAEAAGGTWRLDNIKINGATAGP